jgi:hypothetical protein
LSWKLYFASAIEQKLEVLSRNLPISREQKVNFVWLRVIGERLLNDVLESDRGIRDQGIKVNPPNPIILFGFHGLF